VNFENLRILADRIEQSDDKYFNISMYHSHCRTIHCIAGWCEVLMNEKGMSDDEIDIHEAWQYAMKFLGLDELSLHDMRVYECLCEPTTTNWNFSANHPKKKTVTKKLAIAVMRDMIERKSDQARYDHIGNMLYGENQN